MIRSVNEYIHTVWLTRAPQYSFCGLPVTDMSKQELQAALAFMVQYAGDCKNRLYAAEVE